ncbi:hypothetical protein Tco_0215891 [Tanacetum coccineum]
MNVMTSSLYGCDAISSDDPLGPLLFALMLHPLVCKIKDSFNLSLQAWYLDDGTIIGDALVAGEVLKVIMKDGHHRGLHLNVDKTKVLGQRRNQEAGGPASADFDFYGELVLKRVAKSIELMDVVTKINDSRCELLLLRACAVLLILDLVIGSGGSPPYPFHWGGLVSTLQDIYGDHVVSCAIIVGIKHRHNLVRDTLVDICFWSEILAGKEVDIGLGSSPLTQTGMIDFVPGHAVIEAAQRKRVKYKAKCADIRYGFLPFSFSYFGELESDTATTLKGIRKFSVTQDIGARTTVHIFSRISFAIAKGVRAQIVSLIPSNLLLGMVDFVQERIVTASGPGFGDWQWRLATLPFAFRGLGVYSAGDVLNYAFLASRLQSGSLQTKMLRYSGIVTPGLAFEDALCGFNLKMEIDLLSNPTEIAVPKLMKKLADIYFTRVTQIAESTFSLSTRQMTLWKSQMEDHTSDWLRVVPISGLGQTMNGRTYRCVLCYRLGVPLFSVSKSCSACSRVFAGDIYGDHAVSCAGIVGVEHRHNIVRDTLIDICFRSGISAGKEVDIGLSSSPLTQTGMADFVPGHAVIDAMKCKRVKYEAKCANIGYGFLPFSFSSFGELEEDVIALLKRIRKFFMAQDIGARAAVHVFSRVSFAIARGVGA